MQSEPSPHFDTRCVRAGETDVSAETPPLVQPIYQASVFETPTLDLVDRALSGEPGLYIYTRNANPTVTAFERAVAALEGASEAVGAASGMGAIGSVLLSLLREGGRLVTTSALYGTTLRLMDDYLAKLGIDVTHIEPEAMDTSLRHGAQVVYTETVSNPLLVVADLPRLAELAHSVGAVLVVDNTFATPYHCRPLELGADIVVHSVTKYLGGHSDLSAGVAVGSAGLMAAVRSTVATIGANADPFSAWLALRGLRTLHLRMRRHAGNAQAVADSLATHPKVRAVHYPGLRSHPTHVVASRTLGRGFGGVVGFEVIGGSDGVSRFVSGLTAIRFAASLADVSTTVSHPATTSHRSLTAAERSALGIGEGLVRLSVGIEAADDIVADLERGLAML